MTNLGPQLDFTASEAYKLLRANLVFSFTEDSTSYVIGVTSSVRGEGKSTTSINLAYSFADAGKKVLIVDADLRIPKLAKRFGVRRSPGLSNVLISDASERSVLEIATVNENLYILTSGNIPPNPSELLASERMAAVIDSLKTKFDIIILDLPPMNVVSDALVVSPLLDGFVFVVRENFSTKRAVSKAVNAMEYANAKIFGFVTTCSVDTMGKYGGRYGKYGKYSKYYKYGYKYGSKYESSYQNAYEQQYDQQRDNK